MSSSSASFGFLVFFCAGNGTYVVPSDIVHYRTDLAFIKKALKVMPKSRALCKKKGKMYIISRIYQWYINDGQYICICICICIYIGIPICLFLY